MAQKVLVQMVDDLDGSEAVETVAFGLDANAYEIDLSAANAAKLRKALAKYTGKARKANTTAKAGKRRQRTAGGREQTAAVREWAKSHGYKVNDRGRIPHNVAADYEAAH